MSDPAFAVFAYADEKQAVLWLLRTDCGLKIADDLEILNQEATPLAVQVQVPGMAQGKYRITYWDSLEGKKIATIVHLTSGPGLLLWLPRLGPTWQCVEVSLAGILFGQCLYFGTSDYWWDRGDSTIKV